MSGAVNSCDRQPSDTNKPQEFYNKKDAAKCASEKGEGYKVEARYTASEYDLPTGPTRPDHYVVVLETPSLASIMLGKFVALTKEFSPQAAAISYQPQQAERLPKY